MDRKIAAEVKVLMNRIEKKAKSLKFVCDAIINEVDADEVRQKALQSSFRQHIGEIRKSWNDTELLAEQAKKK